MAEMGSLEREPLPSGSRLARLGFRVAGGALVAIGVLGIFLPLLPTTIFLLGAAACFGKSSPGAYRWLTTNRYFGRYLRDYKEERGASVVAKVVALATLWAGIGFAVYLFRDVLWLDVVLIGIAVAVTVHLLSLRTMRTP